MHRRAAPWEWEALGFDEEADLTPLIRAALDSADPPATLHDLWPWVSTSARLKLLMQVRVGEVEQDVLIARFQHCVRAEWADRYAQPDPGSVLRRLVARVRGTR